MASFRLARDYGIPGIELDIHLSADGKLVVMHDAVTTRTSPGSTMLIEETGYELLKDLDVGAWKGDRWKGEHPPLLADVLEEFTPDMYFDIEIKAPKATDRGVEAALVTLLSAMNLGRNSIIVSSFNPIAIKRFKALRPDVATGIIYCDSDELPFYLRHGEGRWLGRADFLKPEHIMVKRLAMSVKRVTGGRPVLPWTVDEQQDADRLMALGCAGFISNKPHLAWRKT